MQPISMLFLSAMVRAFSDQADRIVQHTVYKNLKDIRAVGYPFFFTRFHNLSFALYSRSQNVYI